MAIVPIFHRTQPAAPDGLSRGRTLVLLLCGVVLWSAASVARAESPGQPVEPGPGVVALGTDGAAASVTAGQHEADDSLAGLDQAEQEFEEYDPWESFNTKTFKFNYELDKHAMKPVAEGYDKVVPNFVERAISNIFDNIGSFRRIINLAVQGRFNDSGQELGRFVINTFFGLGGFVDAAPSFGVGKVSADTGQTLGLFGVGPGPYFMLPFFEPLTVRDAIGLIFDSAMEPTSWLVPFQYGYSGSAVRRINDRALALELFENVEETTFDLYGAVRNGYLQRRRALIREARAKSPWYREPKRSKAESLAVPDAGRSPAPPPAPREGPPPEKTAVPASGGALSAVARESFLIVDATPTDAEVFLDGGLLGSAGELVARALPLPSGRHTITIADQGFRPYVASFVADPSFATRIRMALEPE